jgi:hypothetical protein
VVVLFFDRQMYMIFAPGQLRVCQEIGSGEVAYDTLGMVVVKQRSGLFRHWLLGFGSGDRRTTDVTRPRLTRIACPAFSCRTPLP